MAAGNRNTQDMNEDKSHPSTSNDTGNLYSGLFNTPASSAPVIITLLSDPGSFSALTLQQKKLFISALLDTVGPVKPDTKCLVVKRKTFQPHRRR
jgi:hypothetical protein